jgi:hypothetical protein
MRNNHENIRTNRCCLMPQYNVVMHVLVPVTRNYVMEADNPVTARLDAEKEYVKVDQVLVSAIVKEVEDEVQHPATIAES